MDSHPDGDYDALIFKFSINMRSVSFSPTPIPDHDLKFDFFHVDFQLLLIAISDITWHAVLNYCLPLTRPRTF